MQLRLNRRARKKIFMDVENGGQDETHNAGSSQPLAETCTGGSG